MGRKCVWGCIFQLSTRYPVWPGLLVGKAGIPPGWPSGYPDTDGQLLVGTKA